ncbi:suppressor of fused domain protein [Aureispira sp. CCB-E]|uniref:suppressor of fused domain protein n=1 Tax=Aureispira sp. CCB-E TaxID=3051121 RepID=UPI0028696324|nr:suppressor of fused domain protein [Aureispira sp. CCB-E]WMX16226.1 suppressor of fused domain protein [Aureispira sp. CCB-E]
MDYIIKFLEKKSDLISRFELKNGVEAHFLTFLDRPFKGANSIITDKTGGEENDFEFIISFSSYNEELDFEIKSLLATYLDFHYYKSGIVVREGDYFKIPNFQLIDGFDYIGFYTLHPAYFPQKISSKYLWLLPIFESEYQFLLKFGSDKFQDLMEEQDIDLTMLDRKPLV